MKKKKDLDLAPSRRERKTLGQYILLFFLVLYTLFCVLCTADRTCICSSIFR